jgi:alpha-tubulin suppressor-like RCC1 family protein
MPLACADASQEPAGPRFAARPVVRTPYCPCVQVLRRPSQVVRFKSPFVKIGLGAAIAAALVLSVGCSAQHSQRPAADAKHSAPAKRKRPSPPPIIERPSTVEHWGSYFGARKGKNYDQQDVPVALTVPGAVTQVGTSNSTQYVLLTNGTVWAWGLGTHGELGDGGTVNSLHQPVQVHFPAGVKIAFIPTDVMPYDTALAVDTQGHVWGWGLNGGGELCLGDHRMYTTPVRLPFSHVTTLAGASNHALYDSDGTVYACGQNLEGDLGTGSMTGTTRPKQVAGLDGSSVTDLVASFANSGALLSNGKYYDWGFNAAGQLGDGQVGAPSDVPVAVQLPHPVSQVAQGGSIWKNGQTIALLSDGSLWSWGNGWAGQLGNGVRLAEPVPARFSAPAGVTYQSLATGSATSYAITTTGKVYAWGVGALGQVGNGSTLGSPDPVVVADHATLISATANNVLISVPKKPRKP